MGTDLQDNFNEVTEESKDIFENKLHKYGPSFLVLRPHSLIDKLYLKARRIRRLEELEGERKVEEGRETECFAIINFSAVGLMNIWYGSELPQEPGSTSQSGIEDVFDTYEEVITEAEEMAEKKTHDYDKAIERIQVTSITDIILDKILRSKHMIGSNPGSWTPDSKTYKENLNDEFVDLLNYSALYIVKLRSNRDPPE